MIAKRVTRALMRQDWTMVAIEFVLVVLGVLLAFQINDWANARSEAQAQREVTERLLDESEDDIAHVREGIQFIDRVVNDLSFALDRVTRGSWSPTDEKRMRDGFYTGRFMTAIVPPTSVYDNIVAEGALNMIATPDARAKISAFHGTLDYDERTRQQFLPIVMDYEKLPEFTYRIDPRGLEPPDMTIDYQAFSRDLAGQRLIAITTGHLFGLRWIRKRALRESIEMCRALAAGLNRKCNEHKPLPIFN